MKNRIKELREERGWSQSDLASKAKISRPFLSTIETGAANPSVVNAVMISSALGKTVEEVFIGLSKEEK